MRDILFLFVLLGTLSCKDRRTNVQENTGSPLERVIDSAISYRTNEPIELKDLYPLQEKVLPIEKEKLFLLDALKERGFQTIGWGRDIAREDRRIVYYVLRKDNCFCETEKVYNATPEGTFKVSERIRCSDSVTFYGR